MPTHEEVLQRCYEALENYKHPGQFYADQARQDQAREVALQCAVEVLASPNRSIGTTAIDVLKVADIFITFLLGEDKP